MNVKVKTEFKSEQIELVLKFKSLLSEIKFL